MHLTMEKQFIMLRNESKSTSVGNISQNVQDWCRTKRVTICLSDDDDMMRQRRQLYAQGNVLSRRFHMCSLEVKNVLFRTFCTPLYTCQLWSRYTARSLHLTCMLCTTMRFRMMPHLPTYCSASEMFTVNRVPNCAAVIRNLTFRLLSRLGLSMLNALVCSIIDSDLKFVSRIRLHWMNMLYVHFSGG